MIDQGILKWTTSDGLTVNVLYGTDTMLYCSIEDDLESQCVDKINLGAGSSIQLTVEKDGISILYYPDIDQFDIAFLWGILQDGTFYRVNLLPDGYSDYISWYLNADIGFQEGEKDGFCGIRWVDNFGNEQAPIVREGGIFDVNDVGKDSTAIFEVQLSSELAGNITETTTAGIEGQLAQILKIVDSNSGEATIIRLTPSFDYGMTLFEYQVEDSEGNVEFLFFVCMDECEEIQSVNDLEISFAADLMEGVYAMNYTTPSVLIEQILDTESQMWTRVVTANETEQYFRTWDYEFINLNETPTFLYDLEIKVYGNEIFTFDEMYQLFPGFSNYTYEVMRDDDVADVGVI